jgi:hypothetical protein
LGFIHVVACFGSLFLFISLYRQFVIHLPDDGRLHVSRPTIVIRSSISVIIGHRAAVNFHVQVLEWTCLHFSQVDTSE